MVPPTQRGDAASASVLIPSLQLQDRQYASFLPTNCKTFSSPLGDSRHERDEQNSSRSIRLTVPRAEKLEAVPHSSLYLPGIAKSIANRPVKVEQQRCRRRIAEIVAIQDVEHLNQRLELTPPSHAEGTRKSDIPARERVVAANRVPQQDRAVGADSVRRRCRALPARLIVDALLRCRL